MLLLSSSVSVSSSAPSSASASTASLASLTRVVIVAVAVAVAVVGVAAAPATAAATHSTAPPPPPPSSSSSSSSSPPSPTSSSADGADFRAALVYLVTGPSRVAGALPDNSHPVFDYVADMKVSLAYLHENFNARHRYPIVVFHTGLSERACDELRDAARGSRELVRFVAIDFDFPDELPVDERERVDGRTCSSKPWHVNYLHMNRFFVRTMMSHPALDEFDYYARIDTDLFVKKPLDADWFAEVHSRNGVFGYWRTFPERDDCVHGLADAIAEFRRTYRFHLQRTRLSDEHRALVARTRHARVEASPNVIDANVHVNVRLAYFGCWGLGSVAFFRSAAYQALARFLDERLGIYYHRWADQVIYQIAVSLFAPGRAVFFSSHAAHLQHNKHYPNDLCSIVPDHHKCAGRSTSSPPMTREQLRLEPVHAGAYAHHFTTLAKSTAATTTTTTTSGGDDDDGGGGSGGGSAAEKKTEL